MNYLRLLFLGILISNLFVTTYGMETNTEPLVVLFPAIYANSIPRAYAQKVALKCLLDTESEVRYFPIPHCVPIARRAIPRDSIKAALVQAVGPIAGMAAGAATLALPSLLNIVCPNIMSPEVQEIIKETSKVIIFGNAISCLPICVGNLKTNGYEILECIQARAMRNRNNAHQQ